MLPFFWIPYLHWHTESRLEHIRTTWGSYKDHNHYYSMEKVKVPTKALKSKSG